jgi:hypothetical protein
MNLLLGTKTPEEEQNYIHRMKVILPSENIEDENSALKRRVHIEHSINH